MQTAAAGEASTTGEEEVEEEGAWPQHQGAGLEGVALPAAPAEVRRSSTYIASLVLFLLTFKPLLCQK